MVALRARHCTAMAVLLRPPIAPMLAKAAAAMPDGDGWWFEPKWDGFRCIVFRDGDELILGSRNERPLTRYFPEVLDPLRTCVPDGAVVDGELIVASPHGHGLDFDALLQRIHPAESRVRRLAAETPARFVAFDLLADGNEVTMALPFEQRRARLEAVLGDGVAGWVSTTAVTTDRPTALDWFARFEGAGLDGVVAKPGGEPYRPGERTMIKVKHHRSADCVVAGYRVHKDGKGVGSLLLGLHDDDGRLHHVGVAASFTAKARAEMLTELAPLVATDLAAHPWGEWAVAQAHESTRMPGAQSRWSAGKNLSFVPLRPERVVEVAFSQLEGRRFRHGASLVRWRPDRDPASCRYDQLDVATRIDAAEVLGS
jgi:ATP-dependent DNA ligase